MLLSRVADSLYWIGRYLERAEQMARVVDIRLDLGLDRRGSGWDFGTLYAIARVAPPADPPANPSALVDAWLIAVGPPLATWNGSPKGSPVVGETCTCHKPVPQ